MSDNKQRYTIVELPLEMFVLSDYIDPDINEHVFISFSVSVAGQQVGRSAGLVFTSGKCPVLVCVKLFLTYELS